MLGHFEAQDLLFKKIMSLANDPYTLLWVLLYFCWVRFNALKILPYSHSFIMANANGVHFQPANRRKGFRNSIFVNV